MTRKHTFTIHHKCMVWMDANSKVAGVGAVEFSVGTEREASERQAAGFLARDLSIRYGYCEVLDRDGHTCEIWSVGDCTKIEPDPKSVR